MHKALPKSSPPNIIITGFMGTGKTTVGRLLAQHLGFDFVDTDDLIVKAAAKSIPQIFAQEAEAGFRRREREAIQRLKGSKGLVVATGGGAVLSPQNLANLKTLGPVFCLWASPRAIYRRLRETEDRPLLRGDHPQKQIKSLLQQRTPHYQKADKIFDTTGKSPQKVVKEILAYLERPGDPD